MRIPYRYRRFEYFLVHAQIRTGSHPFDFNSRYLTIRPGRHWLKFWQIKAFKAELYFKFSATDNLSIAGVEFPTIDALLAALKLTCPTFSTLAVLHSFHTPFPNSVLERAHAKIVGFK